MATHKILECDSSQILLPASDLSRLSTGSPISLASYVLSLGTLSIKPGSQASHPHIFFLSFILKQSWDLVITTVSNLGAPLQMFWFSQSLLNPRLALLPPLFNACTWIFQCRLWLLLRMWFLIYRWNPSLWTECPITLQSSSNHVVTMVHGCLTSVFDLPFCK